MIQFHPRSLILLILVVVCLLTSVMTIQAQSPELIGIANLNNGDLQSGIFTIDGVILDAEQVAQVAVKVGNGPWETALGVSNWTYTVDTRQIVTGSSFVFNSATENLVDNYQVGPYYGDLPITIAALDVNGNQVATRTLTVTIIPETPFSDLPSGTYTGPLDLILKARPEVNIYYTLDGTDPRTNGTLYGGSFPVTRSTVINAAAKNSLNQYSEVMNLNLTITNSPAPPTFTIQYYYDQALTQPAPNPPYLKAGVYYLKVVSNQKLTANPCLVIAAPGTTNNVNQISLAAVNDCVYCYTRVVSQDQAADGSTQELITLSGTDNNGNPFQNVAPLNAATNAAYPDTQPPDTGSIILDDAVTSTNNPMPNFLINSNGASQMRLALSEAGLATANWVDYATRYGGFDISTGGNGLKTIWIEFRDRAGNIQTQHANTVVTYDNSVLGFDIEYFADPNLTASLGVNPVLTVGTYYLKITTNQDLNLNPGPVITIDAEGVNNDVANGVTTQVTNRVYYFTRTIAPDPAAIGAVLELITINGQTPLNAATMAAYTTTTVLTPAAPILTATCNQVTVTWTAMAGVTGYQIWYGISSDSNAAVQYGNDLTATTCIITGLSSGNTYYFWLKAKNQSGVSGFSAPATVDPGACDTGDAAADFGSQSINGQLGGRARGYHL